MRVVAAEVQRGRDDQAPRLTRERHFGTHDGVPADVADDLDAERLVRGLRHAVEALAGQLEHVLRQRVAEARIVERQLVRVEGLGPDRRRAEQSRSADLTEVAAAVAVRSKQGTDVRQELQDRLAVLIRVHRCGVDAGRPRDECTRAELARATHVAAALRAAPRGRVQEVPVVVPADALVEDPLGLVTREVVRDRPRDAGRGVARPDLRPIGRESPRRRTARTGCARCPGTRPRQRPSGCGCRARACLPPRGSRRPPRGRRRSGQPASARRRSPACRQAGATCQAVQDRTGRPSRR